MSERVIPAEPAGTAVAIIGMAGRFPQSPTLDAFWRNLRDGVECLTRFTDEELSANGVPDALRRNPAYVPVRGMVDGKDRFAASFFGFNPREAELTDPQQRLLLEVAWEAMEDAGYDPGRPSGPVGVYVGVGMNSYLLTRILRSDHAQQPGAAYEIFVGNDKDFSATHISYKLGLKGPSVNVQTACSTSLVAVHLACQALLAFQCDMALAGAASLSGALAGGYLYSEGMIHSPDGHCRPFDAAAKGTVGGEAVAVVTLKRLEDALADGDPVRGVILGTGINNDGADKAGFTAPSVDGQREAIVLAQAMAQVEPDSIGYVEGHGTATPLGDPIEVRALTQAFREGTSRVGFCALGSVKSNIGHTDTVAGVAGLIKTVLALEHREIPPTLHFTAPNPALDLPASPFFVNTTARPWERGATPRRAAVSSFGIGGTNAHAVLEEAPPRAALPASSRWQVLTLSARTESALDAATERLREHLANAADPRGLTPRAADVAFTLQEGRRAFAVRRTVVCRSVDGAVAAIAARDPKAVQNGTATDQPPAVAFMFSGQGTQYPGMGAELYATEPAFREAIDECAARFAARLGEDLRDVFLKPPADASAAPGVPADAAAKLTRTLWAQPSIFAFDYALAKLWIARGVEPDAMIGHSLGEYVAATLAGVFSLDDATRLVATRARLMDALPAGAMTAVYASEGDVARRLPAELSIAAVNGPSLVVASGPIAAVESFERALAAAGINTRRLHTSHAFHSAMMEPMLEAFRAALAQATFNAPARRYVSNVTGGWITAAEACSPDYWLRHLRWPVRFADGVRTLAANADRLLLEVGPGHALASLARQQATPVARIVSSARHADESDGDAEVLARATAALWRHGVTIDWRATHVDEPCVRVSLPAYPFERERYWIDAQAEPALARGARRGGELVKNTDVGQWFTTRTWARTRVLSRPGTSSSPAADRWVVFDDAGETVATRLRQLGVRAASIVAVQAGVAQAAGERLSVRPSIASDYVAALDEASRRFGAPPTRIVHAWGVDSSASREDERELDTFFSLLSLAQATAQRIAIKSARIDIVVTGAVAVTGDERIVPARAAVMGLARVVPQEYPHLKVSVLDLDAAAAGVDTASDERWASHFLGDDVPALVAWRGRHEWRPSYTPVTLPEPAARPSLLARDGVYLVTGAFGNIGAQLCDWLADEGVRGLVLVGRQPRANANQPAGGDASPDRFVDVDRLAARGVDVLVVAADVSDAADVRRVLDEAHGRFGRIAGIFHCAGTISGAAIPELTREACDLQFGGKCRGLWHLLDALRATPPDFVACTSSISVVLGGLGFGAYASANAVVDATADAYPEHRVMAIGWDSWEPRSGRGAAAGLAIAPHEGRAAWRRILDAGPAHVVVSTADLDARIRRWAPLQASGAASAAAPAASPSAAHARPALSVPYTPPSTDAERTMAGIWSELLGVAAVGVHDNFFELGGHSLLATQLLARIRDAFGVQLPLRVIFDANTVAELARHVAGVQGVASDGLAVTTEEREEIEL